MRANLAENNGMPAYYRRYIFWGFILLFLVTAPIVILYTAGYRYNWQRGKIQETGILLADYRPTTALLRVDDAPLSKKSPARIAGLPEGRYTITLTKEGYHPWEKRLWIEPGKTTFAQHMILWKKEVSKTLVQKGPFLHGVPSRKGSAIALVGRAHGNRITIIDTKNNTVSATITLPHPETRTITSLVWSPNGKRLLIERGTGATREQFVATINNGVPAPVALTRFFAAPLVGVTWDARDDDRLYGYSLLRTPSHEYQLIAIDLFRGTTETAALPPTPTPSPYSVEDDLLYRIHNGNLFITAFTESSRALERRLALPDSSESTITFLPGGPETVMTILDKKQKRLFLIDKETRTLYPIQETIEGVSEAQWSPQGNRLVWRSGKELWILDLERAIRERMVVTDKKIQELAWDPKNEYVFYTVDDTVHAIEVDNRDRRNDTSLFSLPHHRGLTASADGTTLFMTGLLENNDGLFALSITDR